ncbi:hypothetical protein ACFVWX_22965 [Streptomyces sp. NPDC058220]|uniref:hypothetical protein n=1 Tax=Streptomyces sp. NPDC058220 TaxID=3346387 RepID=UPI0036EBE772
MIHWLQHSTSARLLATLAAEHTEITHQLLDGLTQDRNTCHVRETLVATGVLPRRQEILIHLKLWLNDFADALPAHQARIIRPFAEWQVLRDARRRSARSSYTAGAATADRTDIRTAAKLLTWLDANQLDLSTLAQEDLDFWLTTHPTLRRGIRSFIRWTLARRLTSGIVLRRRPRPSPRDSRPTRSTTTSFDAASTTTRCHLKYASSAPWSGSTACRPPASSP